MYAFFEKHVRLLQETRTCFFMPFIYLQSLTYRFLPDPIRHEAPEGKPSGALFCNCFRSSQRSGRKNFIFFSTNGMPPVPLHRVLRSAFCVASSNYLIIKLFLFYHCLHSFFAFYANDYDTGRYVDRFIVGSNHCVDNILA